MRPSALKVSLVVLLAALLAASAFVAGPARAARPYEGQTIRAVVNAATTAGEQVRLTRDYFDGLESGRALAA